VVISPSFQKLSRRQRVGRKNWSKSVLFGLVNDLRHRDAARYGIREDERL
jgi:hypothetical protein